jgi:hypothetical protein
MKIPALYVCQKIKKGKKKSKKKEQKKGDVKSPFLITTNQFTTWRFLFRKCQLVVIGKNRLNT